jgi:hypothetical protein
MAGRLGCAMLRLGRPLPRTPLLKILLVSGLWLVCDWWRPYTGSTCTAIISKEPMWHWARVHGMPADVSVRLIRPQEEERVPRYDEV